MDRWTGGQAVKTLELINQSGISLEQLQKLLESGLFSPFLKADVDEIDFAEFERVIGIQPSIFRLKMGGSNDTNQITVALGFPFNEWINQSNFPLKPSETPWEDEIEIVDPGKSFSEEEGFQILKDKGLERPTYEHGIRFAEQFGKTTTSKKKPFVFFLHDAWQDPDRNRRIVCLDRGAGYRKLYLNYPDDRFGDNCVLAGVRPRK